MESHEENINPLSQFRFHSRNPSSLVDPSELDVDTLDAHPDAFYRRVSVDNQTNLPDILIEDASSMASKKVQTRVNGSSPKSNSTAQPATLPRTTFKPPSNPPAATHTPNGSISKPGVIKERVRQFDQSAKGQVSHSRPTTPHSNASKDSTKPKTPHSKRREPAKKPLLFGEVVDSGTEAGYGIPSLTKQRSNLELNLPKSSAGTRVRRYSDQHSNTENDQLTKSESAHHSRSTSGDTEIDHSPISSTILSPSRIPRPRTNRRASETLASRTTPRSKAPNSPPVTLSNRRYSPKREQNTGQTLTAVIKEPPPKLSPTLRSSRPRQPVSTASTAASRARVSERFTKSIAEKSVPRNTPKDIVPVDVAMRRDQVSEKLARTYVNRPTSEERHKSKDSTGGASRRDLTPLIEAALADEDKSVIDDSPVDIPTHTPASNRAQETLLKQVLYMREQDPNSPEFTIPEDMLSEIRDGETVHIVLGATPKLPSENFANSEQPNVPDSIEEEEFDWRDGRSTICPDDSVSVIFQSRLQEMASPPPVPKLDHPTQFTIDSAARSQINRVLEEYQGSEMATPKPPQVEEKRTPDRQSRTKDSETSSFEVIRKSSSTMDDDLDDEEYHGHAIIYTTSREHQSASDATPRAPSGWDTSSQKSYSFESNRKSEGLGVMMDSPYSHIPPVPDHAPPAPPVDQMTQLSNIQTWGLSSPNKSRRDDLDKNGSSQNVTSPGVTSPATANSMLDSRPYSAEKDLKERWNLIKELVDTEHSFFHDMTIGVDIFMATANAVLTVEDRRVIFGNLERIREFVSTFLDALKKSVYTVYQIPSENRFGFKRTSGDTAKTGESPSNSSGQVLGTMPEKEVHSELDRETSIGAIFCQYAKEMDSVYRDWMIHQEASNKRILQVQTNPQVKMWLDECYANARDITNAWSLDSLLVKPTQRYMKYPLLLRNFIKCTPSDHPDYEQLSQALEAIEKSVNDINDEKRRRELAGQFLKKQQKDNRNKEPATRLNLKNLVLRKKKRNPSMPGQGVGLEDDSYEAIRQKFGGHFFQLQIVMRDFEKYMEDCRLFMHRMTRYVETLEHNYSFDNIIRYPEEESRVHRFVEVVNSIQRHALTDHLLAVQRFVIDPVRKLWHLHENPQHLMGKHRKLKPQYTKYLATVDRKDKVNDKLKLEADQYLAINDILKKELPQLYTCTKEIVHCCLRNFLDIQVRWSSMWMQKLNPLIYDFNPNTFFVGDMTEFFQHVREDFFQTFDQWDEEHSSQSIATRKYLKDDEFNFLEKMPEPDGHDYSHPGSSRPSTSGKRPPVSSHSARGSVEHAARSTPNLGLGSPQATPSSHPHRLSYNNALSPLPVQFGGFFANEAFYTQGSGPNSGGPNTPIYPPSGQQTPSALPGSGFAGQRQWFTSDWAPHMVAQTSSSTTLLNDNERLRMERGHDAIEASHAAHRHHMEQQFQQTPSTSLLSPPADHRFSGIFHSALPADLTEDEQVLNLNGPEPVTFENEEPRVLFVVASLFEFHIDSNRREAGFPYLKYVAGEVFDILAQRGELWLARNQDDPEGTLGWIWEKHFALLPTEET